MARFVERYVIWCACAAAGVGCALADDTSEDLRPKNTTALAELRGRTVAVLEATPDQDSKLFMTNCPEALEPEYFSTSAVLELHRYQVGVGRAMLTASHVNKAQQTLFYGLRVTQGAQCTGATSIDIEGAGFVNSVNGAQASADMANGKASRRIDLSANAPQWLLTSAATPGDFFTLSVALRVEASEPQCQVEVSAVVSKTALTPANASLQGSSFDSCDGGLFNDSARLARARPDSDPLAYVYNGEFQNSGVTFKTHINLAANVDTPGHLDLFVKGAQGAMQGPWKFCRQGIARVHGPDFNCGDMGGLTLPNDYVLRPDSVLGYHLPNTASWFSESTFDVTVNNESGQRRMICSALGFGGEESYASYAVAAMRPEGEEAPLQAGQYSGKNAHPAIPLGCCAVPANGQARCQTKGILGAPSTGGQLLYFTVE